MPTYTRAEWRRMIREERPDLTDKEVRDVASLAHKRYEDRLDERPGDFRINGLTSDPTPAEAIPSAQAAINAARRIRERSAA